MNIYVSNISVPRIARNKRVYTHYVGTSYYKSSGGGSVPITGGVGVSSIPYDIDFCYNDFTLGTAKSYTMDLLAQKAYKINGVVFRCDTGTFTGVDVKINGTTITGLSSLTITDVITTTMSVALNNVIYGDIITIHLSTGYTGTPTIFEGKLLRQLV